MTERLLPAQGGIERAAELLRAGRLVAFATETVYGLGADATSAAAVAAVFVAKGRPLFNPLICHYPSAAAAFDDVVASGFADRLAERFWPGPLTMVLKRQARSPVALLAAAGLPTLAVRVPAQPDALALLRAVNRPVAAPSANRSGQISPSCADHVLAGLAGRIDAVLDCGACTVGVESSVIDLSGPMPRLLRPGGTTREAIEAVIGRVQTASSEGEHRSPGLMASHYAPRVPVRLAAISVEPNEALLAFGPPLSGSGTMFQLSATGNVVEAAARLFAGLHWLDGQCVRLRLAGIAVMPIPRDGLGLAIADRLARAAAERPE
jgi:L-threonylcarbamoyladenylate synthase